MKKERILLLCPSFRGYDKALENKMIELGYDVVSFNDIPQTKLHRQLINSPSLKVKLRLILKYLEERNERRILNGIKNQQFDYVIIIKGTYLTDVFYRGLKKQNPKAKYVMYQWDSLVNYGKFLNKNYLNYKNYFDRIYSFDPYDCKNNAELEYLPLFYKNEYADEGEKPTNSATEYDLFFIGGNHKNRFKIIYSIYKDAKRHNLKCKFLLLGGIKHDVPADGEIEFIDSPISHNQIINYFRNCKVAIDIQSSAQTGLTIRTFEALAAGRKLATSNKWIEKEPFFDSTNIFVFDPENPSIPIEFVKSESKPLDITNYSVASFVNKLLGNN